MSRTPCVNTRAAQTSSCPNGYAPSEALQNEVLATLRARRHPDSTLTAPPRCIAMCGSPRFSEDIALFHDAAEVVAANAGADADVLLRFLAFHEP